MTDILWDSRGTSKDPMLGSSGFPCLIFFSFNFVLLVVFLVVCFFGWVPSFPQTSGRWGSHSGFPTWLLMRAERELSNRTEFALGKAAGERLCCSQAHPEGGMLAQARPEQHVLLVLWPRATSGFSALLYQVASGLRLISQTTALFRRWHPLTCFIYISPSCLCGLDCCFCLFSVFFCSYLWFP